MNEKSKNKKTNLINFLFSNVNIIYKLSSPPRSPLSSYVIYLYMFRYELSCHQNKIKIKKYFYSKIFLLCLYYY